MIKIKGIKEVNPTKDLGAWGEIKKFHKTGMGKAMIWGGVGGLAIKAALGYGLYKAGQSSGRKKQVKEHKTTYLKPGGKYEYKVTSYKKEPKKYMAG